MKVIGYLIVMALFGGQHKSFFDKVSNLSIDIQNVGQLFNKLFESNITTDGPVFTEEDVRRANFVNKGTVAKYYSKALRDYIIYHNVSAEEEGFVVTLNNINKPPAVKDESYTNDEDKSPRVIFLPKRGVDVNDKTLNTVIAEYMDTIQDKIDSKKIGVVEKITRNDILQVDDKNKHLTVHPVDQSQTTALEELSKSNDKDIKVLDVGEQTTVNITSNESLDVNKTESVSSGSDLDNTEENSSIDEELSKSNDKEIKVLDVGEEANANNASNESLNNNKTETISSGSDLNITENNASIEPYDNSSTEESSEGSVPETLNENELTNDIKDYDSNNFMSETSNEEIN